nr:glycosyltransferase [Leifsonia sp. Leaf325]
MTAQHHGRHLSMAVAMRVYNSERFVGDHLRSLITQSVVPDEIVIGDDGSTDGTRAVIETVRSEAAERPESAGIVWTLLPSEHHGIAGNIERTMAACTADIVVVCDHDDISYPDRFERIRDAFESRPALLFVHGDADLIDETGASMGARLAATQAVSDWERGRYGAGEALDVLIRRNIVTGATAAFRRVLLQSATPFPRSWVYDEWLGIVAAGLGGTDYLGDPTIGYRQHSSNKTGVRRRGARERMALLLTPGAARNERLRTRAEVLVSRFESLGDRVPPARLALAQQKLDHERARNAFPVNRLRRAIPVLRAASTGAYGRFARGRKDVLLDLVQPIR